MELETQREIQEQLINKVFRFLGYTVFPVLLINLSRYFIVGWLYTFNYYIIAAFLIFAVSLNVKKLPYTLKAAFLVFCFLSLAVSTGLNFGMVSFVAEFLLLTIFTGVIFLPKKPALMVLVLSVLLLAGIAFLSIKGFLPLVSDFEKHIDSIPSWASYLVTFSFMASIIIFIAGDIGNLLAEKMKALEKKSEEVRTLQGILPICSSCKKIRDDHGYWYQVESYIENHSNAQFSHSICDDCYKKLYGNEKWYDGEE